MSQPVAGAAVLYGAAVDAPSIKLTTPTVVVELGVDNITRDQGQDILEIAAALPHVLKAEWRSTDPFVLALHFAFPVKSLFGDVSQTGQDIRSALVTLARRLPNDWQVACVPCGCGRGVKSLRGNALKCNSCGETNLMI